MDNIPITPGTGVSVATDDVSGAHYQRVKLDIGGDGASSPVTATNPLPVALAGTTAVSLAAPVALDGATLAALEMISLTAPVALDAAAMAALAAAATPATQPVSLAAPVALDAASLAALETIQIGNFPATQAVSLAAPVALDSAALAALESITVQSSALPTGAATEATLAALNAKFASLGIKLAASSLSVAPASDATFGVSLAAPINATTTAYAKSLVLKAAPGVLYGLSGFNSKTTEQFIQLHDAIAEPAANAVPKVLVKVASSSPFTIDFGPRGRAFATGIVVCNSSTGPTATVGAADCWFDGQVG